MSRRRTAPADVVVDPMKAAPAAEEPVTASKKIVVKTVWPTNKFTVNDIVVTKDGVELSPEQAELVRSAAEHAGVELAEKEGEVK